MAAMERRETSDRCLIGRRVRLAVFSGVLLFAVTGHAQVPKFAGTWRPLHLAVTDSTKNITIRQDADTITISEPGNPQGVKTFRIDGAETRTGDRVSKTSWDGEKLVIETVGP